MIRTNLRTIVQLATSLRSNLPEKVGTRNVYLTMFTNNKIIKGPMFKNTKAARTMEYVQVGSCQLLPFLEHCNKRNSDESRTAKILQEKVINMLQTNTRKNHQTSPNRILYQITLIIFLNFSLFNQPLKPSNLGKKATRDYSKFYRQMFLQKLSELTWESSPAVKDPYKLFPHFTKSCISW